MFRNTFNLRITYNKDVWMGSGDESFVFWRAFFVTEPVVKEIENVTAVMSHEQAEPVERNERVQQVAVNNHLTRNE